MEFDTIPKLLKKRYEEYGTRDIVALRKKKFGIWQSITWKELYENVKYFALGLASLGFHQGDHLCIIGNNDPEWIIGMFAADSLRGVAVAGGYTDARPEEIEYLIANSDSTFLLVEDQEQVDKILDIKDRIPAVKKVIYWDDKGLRTYDDRLLMFYTKVIDLGKEFEQTHPELFERSIDQTNSDDTPLIMYSSGTTGKPKGVCLRTGRLLKFAQEMCRHFPTKAGDDLLSYIPLAWPVEAILLMTRAFDHGAIINFPEEPETISEDLREIGPRLFLAIPRQLEAQIRLAQGRMLDSTFLKRLAYGLLLPVGYKTVEAEVAGESPSLFWRALYSLSYLLIFRPLRDKLGLLKIKSSMAGGAALSPEIMRFVRALGVDLRNIYGLSEAGLFVTRQKIDEVSTDGVGTPFTGINLRISDDGELLIKSPGIMAGYYKNPEATAKMIHNDGYLYTGDAAFFRDEGELVIMDRLVDLMRLADGTLFSPMYIENKLKFCPYVKDVIVVGDSKDYVGAFISIDFATTGRWAEAHRIAYTTFRDLSQKSEIYGLIQREITRINRNLPQGTRIKKYALLQKELDADDAELTRSRKLRRGAVAKIYQDLTDAMYAGKKEYISDFEVTYQDGRKMKVRASIKIADAKGD